MAQDRADAYFEDCEKTKKPVTMSGLAYALGFSTRSSIQDYEKLPEFAEVMRRARLRVEVAYESRLHTSSPVGAIFALKNMGWADSPPGDEERPALHDPNPEV